MTPTAPQPGAGAPDGDPGVDRARRRAPRLRGLRRRRTTTVVLMPTWSIIDSRFWKAQVGYLARHYRVVTFDGRGSGRSGRPRGAAAYTDEEYAADTVAVMDATGTDRAVLVALSCAGTWAVHVAAEHPERVLGLFAIVARRAGCTCRSPERDAHPWDEPATPRPRAGRSTTGTTGSRATTRTSCEFFFAQMFTEPHSTKQIEDCVGWAPRDRAADAGRHDGRAARAATARCARRWSRSARRVRCPVTVVHGTDDAIRPHEIGERLAELTGGSLVLLEGSGHGPMARHPVQVNLLIREFVDRVAPARRAAHVGAPAPAPPAGALPLLADRPRATPGATSRSCEELRKLHPDLEVDWLAQHPVTAVLEAAGERVHPASRWLANESAHIEHDAGEHDLHAFQAIRRMDAILVNNFMVFAEVVEQEHYDLVVGDEAWDVDYFLHENPELKRFAFAWMTDFVGWLPMPDGGDRGGAADRRLQRRDDRAAGPLRPGAGPVGVRRQPRGRRAGDASARGCR